jgi:hypothetical protein
MLNGRKAVVCVIKSVIWGRERGRESSEKGAWKQGKASRSSGLRTFFEIAFRIERGLGTKAKQLSHLPRLLGIVFMASFLTINIFVPQRGSRRQAKVFLLSSRCTHTFASAQKARGEECEAEGEERKRCRKKDSRNRFPGEEN